jgi:alpha-ketoglutarate-dependent taurine dioxygenase
MVNRIATCFTLKVIMMMKSEVSEPIFELQNDIDFLKWKERKLELYPKTIDELRVSVSDVENLTQDELEKIQSYCRKSNMVLVSSKYPVDDKAKVKRLGQQLGLTRLDGNLCADNDSISSLTVVDTGRHNTYIPYSNKPISWHTDGYYNAPGDKIRTVMLHCVSPAATGGENALVDHEIVYIHLRDTNPEYIAALMQQDVMTIPANETEGETIRATRSGPVFSINPNDGKLHMRYTARNRSIIWKDNSITREAIACLKAFLDSNSPYIFRYRLEAGENLISNNILHTRTAFKDDESKGNKRLIYRARYFDRMTNT